MDSADPRSWDARTHAHTHTHTRRVDPFDPRSVAIRYVVSEVRSFVSSPLVQMILYIYIYISDCPSWPSSSYTCLHVCVYGGC